MTHHELRYLLQKMYPDAVYGVDFFTGHFLDKDGDDGKQVGEPFILKWKLPTAQPTEGQIHTWWSVYQNEVQLTMQADHMRYLRKQLLADADILVEKAIDQGNTEAEQKARAYRQALRDVTKQPEFPTSFTWPEIPT